MAVWDSVTDADQNIANSSIFKQYKNRSKENWTLYLKPTRSWGSWDKRNPFEITDNLDQTFPVVALTRATIKTSILLKFWKRVPDISKTIGLNRNVLFKIGLGEIPWFHQSPSQYGQVRKAWINLLEIMGLTRKPSKL